MIQANCRQRFTGADLQFVAGVLTAHGSQQDAVMKLLTEESARDTLLDQPKVFEALQHLPEPLPVSANLYFYLLARRVLVEKGVDNREVADYVASLLTEFSRAERVHRLGEPGDEEEYRYVTDLLVAAERAPAERVFFIHSQLGNYSLFITGVFPQHVRYRVWRRGSPSIEFYEEVGSSSYRLASDHKLARGHSLGEIYRQIGQRFRDVRLALNRLSDTLVDLENFKSSRALLRLGHGAEGVG